MLYPSVKELLKNTDSRYSLVIAVAKRAREITDEAEYSKEALAEKAVTLAIDDINNNRVRIVTEKKDRDASDASKEIDVWDKSWKHDIFDDDETYTAPFKEERL